MVEEDRKVIYKAFSDMGEYCNEHLACQGCPYTGLCQAAECTPAGEGFDRLLERMADWVEAG